jgi:hypothetical protein
VVWANQQEADLVAVCSELPVEDHPLVFSLGLAALSARSLPADLPLAWRRSRRCWAGYLRPIHLSPKRPGSG